MSTTFDDAMARFEAAIRDYQRPSLIVLRHHLEIARRNGDEQRVRELEATIRARSE